MRKLGAAPDDIVGSAHAITDDGIIMVGSGSGSQLGRLRLCGGQGDSSCRSREAGA
jgi:hypothetical protein